MKTPGTIRTNICTSHRYRNFWSVPSNWNRKPGKTGRRPETANGFQIARQEKGTPAVGCNTHKILEIVERIDEVKKIPTFNDTVYEIDRNTLDMWVKRLKDELKR